MDQKTKSGKEVIDEFFEEILTIQGVDKKTVEAIIRLHGQQKLTDTNIQNAMDDLLQEELNSNEGKNGKD